jgi:hypothetical protein
VALRVFITVTNITAKKRMKEAARLEDMKTNKKARRLVEEFSTQKNTMLKHLQTGAPTGQKISQKDAARKCSQSS